MHFHLPKPLHGWREFAGEVGIIVLGVLIALTFEQVTEAVSWRFRAEKAREVLREEVGHGFLLNECAITPWLRPVGKLGYAPSQLERRNWLAISGSVQFCHAHHLPIGRLLPPY